MKYVAASLFRFLALSGMLVIPIQAQEYDLVINHGRVIDPETEFDAVANIGIKGGTIATITKPTVEKGKVDDGVRSITYSAPR